MILANKKYRLTLFEGEEIEFRALTAASVDQAYSSLKYFKESPEYIETLFNIITESKYKDDEHKAGTPILVIFLCLKLSGLIKSVELLPDTFDKAREDIDNSIFHRFYADIIRIMPSYKLEELQKKTTNELFELLAFTEKVTGKQLFDTKKMRESIATPASSPVKKGVSGVTQDEIDFLKGIIDMEEVEFGKEPFGM